MTGTHDPGSHAVRIPISRAWLDADLTVPDGAEGLVIFAHGSGSSRHSPRNQAVARALQTHRLATLLADLLTPDEERIDERTAELRFDIAMLARRVVTIVDWTRGNDELHALRVGLFGASTGAAAALIAAAERPRHVAAVVSRGGRPDLAGDALPQVVAPTLLLVGGRDEQVIELNRRAQARMRCPVSLEIVPGASHLFEDPGTLAQVAVRAAAWFAAHLSPAHAS